MITSLFQGSIRCLGTLLLLSYFTGQLTPLAAFAQNESSTEERPVDCQAQRDQTAQSTVFEYSQKAKDFINAKNPQEAAKALTQTFRTLATLENTQLQTGIVEDIVITVNNDASVLDNFVSQSVETKQTEPVAQVLAQILPIVQNWSQGYSSTKTNALAAIARQYATIGQTQKALEIIPQAVQSANFIQGAEFKTIALTDIARAYLAVGQNEQAKKILTQSLSFAQAIATPDPMRKGQVLVPIAVTYAKAGEYNQALQVAQSILNADYYKANAIAEIANQYTQAKQLESTLQVARTLELPDTKAKTLATIAANFAKAGQPEQGTNIFREAVQSAQTLPSDNDRRVYVLAETLLTYAAAGQLDAALEVAQSLDSAYMKARTLSEMATLYAKAGKQAQAAQLVSQTLESAKEVQDTTQKDRVLDEIVTNYLKAGRYEDAFQASQLIQNDSYETNKTAILLKIVTQAVEAGQYGQALKITQALEQGYIDQRNTALRQIALGYGKAGDYNQAIEIAQTIQNYGSTYTYQARTLAAIANILLQSGQASRATELYAQATQVANSLESPGSKAEALAAVALEYAISQQTNKASELLSQALQLAQTQNDASSVSYSLRQIVEEYMRAKQYNFALQIAQSIQEPYERSSSLQGITTQYLEAGQYNQALQVVEIFNTPEEKVRLLLAITNKYIQAQQINNATNLLAQALQLTQTIEGPESKIIVVKADYDGEGNIISKTEVDDTNDRGSFIEEIALKYAEIGQESQALKVAQSLENVTYRNYLKQRIGCYR
jgi:hypothetical protein